MISRLAMTPSTRRAMKTLFIGLVLLTPRLLLAQESAGDLSQKLETARAEVTQAEAAADRPAWIQALGTLGQAQLESGDSADALATHRLALRLAREIDDPPNIAANLLAIGQIHLQAGRTAAGAETLRRAVAAAEPIQAVEILRPAHEALSQASAALGRYPVAYESLRQATELRGSLDEQRLEARLLEMEERYEADRKALETAEAGRQQELSEARRLMASQEGRIRLLSGFTIAGGAALLLLAFSLIGRQRLKGRLVQGLAEKDAVLSQAEDELRASVDEQQRLATMHARAVEERDHLASDLHQTTHEKDRLADELQLSSSKLERTAEQLEQHFIELKRTSADRDRAIGELAQFAGDRDRHLVALEQTSDEVRQITAELERTAQERDQQATQLEHTTAEAERISDALMQASAERDQAVADHEQAATARDRLTDQLAKTSDELEQLRQDCREDISAMADRNAKARERLAEMERFGSTLSQHLKVLLVGVRSSLGALQQDAAAGDVQQLQRDVQRTHLAVGKTVRMLDELQKLLLVGRVVHAPEAVSMSELAYEAIGQVTGLADRRVEVVIAPAMPAVYGDRAQLLEVLCRLLENGGKFMGNQPSPRLQVGHRRDWPKADTPEDVFYVRDNGLGLEAHDQKRVFALFEKLEPDTEGLGIGLSLVQRIIEAHGGRVWVESDGPSRGSTFCFTLARKYASPPPPAATPAPAETP